MDSGKAVADVGPRVASKNLLGWVGGWVEKIVARFDGSKG